MSKWFITAVYYPIKEDKKDDIHLYGFNNGNPDQTNSDRMPQHTNIRNNLLLLLPENIEVESYSKGIIECAINLLNDLCKHSLGKGEDKCNKQKIPEKFAIIIRQLANTLGYLTNCDSWCMNEVKDYDLHEIKRRLDLLKGI